ncbi:hypothetical protein N7G274_005729 [Stereocaulon virgatum]|uniref:Uncharacterized protein n=1 Tax=Stereocaulon virgatum TaxID=373712 RepID=A0ABR4A619_9LECA
MKLSFKFSVIYLREISRLFEAFAANLHVAAVTYCTPNSPSRQRRNPWTPSYFHQNVRHFIYDDTQLVRNLTNRYFFEEALKTSYTKSRAKRGRAFNEYCRLFQEQQQILDDLPNLLREGLPRLSRLEKVSVIGGPSRNPNCSFKGGVRNNGFASTVLGLSYWSYRHKSRYHFIERKGFHSLIESLSQPGISLRGLHIGNWSESEHRSPLKMGLPLSSLSLPDSEDNAVLMSSATSAFANVTNLNLQIDGRGRSPGHEYSVPDLENLFVMLPTMHHLSRLSLGFTHLVLHADETKRVVTSIERHALASLRLRSIRFFVDDMVRLSINHQATLTEVAFDKVRFAGTMEESWTTQMESIEWFTNIELTAFIECFKWRRPNESTRLQTASGNGK